jgi:hypothetical protein
MEGQIVVSEGDKIAFRLSDYPSDDDDYTGLGHFEFTSGISSVSLSGNLLSMGYGDLASSASGCMPYQFYRMFAYAPIYAVYEIFYQDMVLEESCCREMFYGCSTLHDVNDFPSHMNLASYCFYGMFRDCTSLEHPPALP